MDDFHLQKEAHLTVCATEVDCSEAAKRFGVFTVDDTGRVLDFNEKPEKPAEIPGKPGKCLASMGNYAWEPDTLEQRLILDQKKQPVEKKEQLMDPNKQSMRDFGYMVQDFVRENKESGKFKIYVYNFKEHNKIEGFNNVEEMTYWRDIGKIAEFFKANMETRQTQPLPPINLYNPEWIIHTWSESLAPAKTIGWGPLDSTVAAGSIISNSEVRDCVLGYKTKVRDNCRLEGVVAFGDVEIPPETKIRNAILDRGVKFPERGFKLGYDAALDDRIALAGSEMGFDNMKVQINGHYIMCIPKDFDLRHF
jgi:glucose-1-phosphate adenylyltransferase